MDWDGPAWTVSCELPEWVRRVVGAIFYSTGSTKRSNGILVQRLCTVTGARERVSRDSMSNTALPAQENSYSFDFTRGMECRAFGR